MSGRVLVHTAQRACWLCACARLTFHCWHRYVDGRCVFYEKALLESGTLGTKCNSQVVVPHLTQSYTDGPVQADDDDAIPMCTLRNFPSLIDHCIEWARAQFTDRFVQPATDAAKFMADPAAWVAEMQDGTPVVVALPRARAVKSFLDRASGASFDTMVALASEFFHECFRDRIQTLVTAYPQDRVLQVRTAASATRGSSCGSPAALAASTGVVAVHAERCSLLVRL